MTSVQKKVSSLVVEVVSIAIPSDKADPVVAVYPPIRPEAPTFNQELLLRLNTSILFCELVMALFGGCFGAEIGMLTG